MTPDDQALAAELALGVLDGAELVAARARLAGDRAFAAEVARWEEWLAPLALAFPEAVPPPETTVAAPSASSVSPVAASVVTPTRVYRPTAVRRPVVTSSRDLDGASVPAGMRAVPLNQLPMGSPLSPGGAAPVVVAAQP